jgi:hypothetical protein
MRYLFVLVSLLVSGVGLSQGSGFSFNYSGPTQIIVGQDCEAPLQWGHPNTPTAMSNIPGGVIVSFEIYSISGGYDIGDMVPGGSTVTVFYQAVDNFGNNALFGFTISFIDVLPPVFDPFSLPSNITVSCTTNVPPPADVEATDNCDNDNANLTITYTQTNNAQLCTGGTILRRWVADDDLGNTAVFNQTITVTPDNTPPVIANNLQNGMAPCSTAMAQYTLWLNQQRAAFTATDNGCGIMTLSDNAPSPAIITSFCGVVEVTFTATDKCNNSSSVVKTFTITNNVAPVITTPASDASGNCSNPNIAQVFNTWINTHGGATATDDCSSIFWSTIPSSPSLNDTCNAAIEVMFLAGDGCNNFDTTAARFTLTDNTPPNVITDPGTIVLSCTSAGIDSTLINWLVEAGFSAAHDLCTSDASLVQGYRIGGVPLTFEEVLDAWQDSLVSGCKDNVLIGGLGINNVKAYLPVEFTYTDNCNNTAGKIGYFGITDNGRPQFVTMPTDTAFACAENGNWEDAFLEWYNSAGGATYMDLCSEVTVNASITADSAIQYLTAALDTACLQGVSVTIGFGLTDECGNQSLTNPSASFGLQDTIPPVLITSASDIHLPCSPDVQEEFQSWIDTLGGAEASDGCGELSWEFSWTDTSGMVQSGIPGTGPYPQLEDLGCMSGIDITFTGVDICQNAVSDTALFSVLDTLPPDILITEDSIHLTCGDTISLIFPDVSDGCDENPLITFTDSTGIDSCLGIPEMVIRIWTATDMCGNSSSASQWYFRIDSIAPTFDLPPDTSAFCSIDTLVLENVADNCDPNPSVTWGDTFSGQVCNQTLTRIWTVTDACGNSATAEQTFSLTDDAPPVITTSPGNYAYTCENNQPGLQETYEAWQDSVSITDGCSEAFYFIALKDSYVLEDTSTWPGTPVPDSIMIMCGSNMAVEADLVAYDACDNVIVESISFSVNDTVGPDFINCPAVISVEPDTVNCNAVVTLTAPGYEEVCFPDNVKITLIIDGGDTLAMDTLLSIDTLLSVGIHTALWVATDCNGNAGTCLTSVEIIDENALTVICPPDTTLFTVADSCNITMGINPPKTITSSCGKGVITWSGFVVGLADPSAFVFDSAIDTIDVIFNAGLHEIFLVAQDTTGDRDTCSYLLTVRDTFAPAVICQNDSILLSPSGLETIEVSTTGILISASDACGIDTVMYDPPAINCSFNNQDVPVLITVVDANGNTSTCQSIITVNTVTLNPLWESQLCDDTLRLYANLPDGPDSIYTFSWTGPESFVSSEQNPFIPEADSSHSGVYVLIVQSENGCTATGSVEVVIEELSAVPVTASEDTICVGEEIIFSTQSFSGEVSYEWYHVLVTGDTLLGVTTEPQFIYTPFEAGSYSVYTIVSQDTCTSEPGATADFIVLSVPLALIADESVILCVDDTLFLSPEVVFDSLQYTWTGTGGYEAFEPTPPGIPADAIDSAATYVLTASNGYCVSQPDSIVAIVQATPPTPVITGDTLACEGGSFILSAQSGHQSYEWIDPLGNSILTDNDSLLIPVADLSHAGEWTVIAADNGCPSDTSDAFILQIDSAIHISIVTTPQVCEGDSITLSVVPSLAGQYTWGGPGGFSSSAASPTTLAESGDYTVFLISTTGCEASDTTNVQVDVLPEILQLETDADSCVSGTENISIWAQTTPFYSSSYAYQWTGPASFAVIDSSIVIDSATVAVNGIYTLVLVNGTCTTAPASITIDVQDSPAAPLIAGDNVYCYGDSIKLFIDSPIDGAEYAWASNDTNVVIPSPGTLVIPNATPGWTGVYSVVVNVGGCASASSSIAVQVKAALFPPSILTAPLVCEGDSLILISDAPSGSTLHWISSNGFDSFENQPVIYPVLPQDAGTYQVVYTLNGCPSPPSNPYDIIVQPAIAAPVIISDITAVCIDNPIPVELCIDQNSLIAGATYTWLLNGNIIGTPGQDSCITLSGDPLQGGDNPITAFTSVQGCPSPSGNTITITGDEIPTQAANAGVDQVVCPGDVIILNASAPSQGSGAWTSGEDIVIFSDAADPNANIIGLPSGIYGLAWTLSYATCTDYSQDSVTIEVITTPVTFADTVDVPFGQTTEHILYTKTSVPTKPTFGV